MLINIEGENIDVDVVDVPMADGTTITCIIMDQFDYDEQSYMMLAELNKDNTIGESMFCFRCREEDGQVYMDTIEDEAEFQAVQEAYAELLDSFEDDEDEE